MSPPVGIFLENVFSRLTFVIAASYICGRERRSVETNSMISSLAGEATKSDFDSTNMTQTVADLLSKE